MPKATAAALLASAAPRSEHDPDLEAAAPAAIATFAMISAATTFGKHCTRGRCLRSWPTAAATISGVNIEIDGLEGDDMRAELRAQKLRILAHAVPEDAPPELVRGG